MGVTAIYTRISRDRVGERGGVERQRVDCSDLCERNGWSFVEFEDNDTSAYSGKPRPGYVAMLDAVKNGVVERIVAWHPDRLHRHPRELEDFIDLIESTGCEIATVSAGAYDLTTVAGRQLARILGAVARGESEHKSERIRRKHQELAERGAWKGGGKRAYGYEAIVDPAGKVIGFKVVKAEAKVIREVMTRFLAGDSISAIGRDLNERGVPASMGGKWTGTTLRAMVSSARLSGQREHKGRILGPGTWPAIVTPEETTRARALLRASAAAWAPAAAKRMRPRSYVLSGLVTCAKCGTRMVTGRDGRHVRRYACSGGVGKAGCGRTAIIAEPLEQMLVEAVMRAVDSPGFAQSARRRSQIAESTCVDDVDMIRSAEAQLAELADAYADNLISMADWVQARRRIENRSEVAQARIAEANDATILPYVAKPGVLRAAWQSMSLPMQAAIISWLIEVIEIGPPSVLGGRFDSGRVAIRWRV